MDSATDDAKPGTLIGIALTAVGAAAVLGAATNAVNGAVSPTYFAPFSLGCASRTFGARRWRKASSKD